jgi:hypothetical protein
VTLSLQIEKYIVANSNLYSRPRVRGPGKLSDEKNKIEVEKSCDTVLLRSQYEDHTSTKAQHFQPFVPNSFKISCES